MIKNHKKDNRLLEAGQTVETNLEKKQSLDEVSRKLEELIVEAKKSGDSAVQFLATDMFLKASSAQIHGDYATANFLYQHLSKLLPNELYIQKKYAISLIKAGDLTNAEVVLNGIYRKDQSEEKVGLILAGVQSGLGKTKQAKKIYTSILKKNPKSKDACLFLSKVHSIEEQYDKAQSVLLTCQNKSKDKSEFLYYRGKLSLEQGKLREAQTLFTQAYKLDSSLSEAALALGLIEEEQGKIDNALKIYRKHLKKHENDEVILLRFVQVLFAEEKFKEVIPYAEKLIDLEPDNLNLKVKLGIIYSDLKNYKKAIAIFKDLLVFAPESDRIMYYLGAIYQETNQHEEAIKYFGRINAESALFSDSVLQIANMLSLMAQDPKREDRSAKAKEFLAYTKEKAEAHEALKVELKVIKSNYHDSLNELDEAIALLEEVKEHADFTNTHRYYLASLYEKKKLYQESEQLVFLIVEKEPQNAHAWNFLGYSLLERGEELDKAYQYITKAVKLKPNDGYIRDSLGWYYYKLGKLEKALKETTQAVKHSPGDVIITKHLAQIYQAMKKYKEAKRYYVEALKYAKQDSQRQDIANHLQQLEKSRQPANKKK